MCDILFETVCTLISQFLNNFIVMSWKYEDCNTVPEIAYINNVRTQGNVFRALSATCIDTASDNRYIAMWAVHMFRKLPLTPASGNMKTRHINSELEARARTKPQG
jgi:hypothetical protein